MGVEALDGLKPPGLALPSLRLGPHDGLPVRRQDQSRAGIGELNSVSGRFPHV